MEKKTASIGQLTDRESLIFDMNRGRSIAAYSGLEGQMCALFAHLANVEQRIAWEIFYTFQGSRSRNSIVTKLLHVRHNNRFQLFWKSMNKHIESLDTKRNHIVHWTSIATPIWEDGVHSGWKKTLAHPTLQTLQQARITNSDMVEFIKKCTFISTIIAHFYLFLLGKDAERENVFNSSLSYPPEKDHFLYHIYEPQREPKAK